MEQNSIVVKNVTKKFDDFMLDHISFTVPTGRIVGFIGENGAGKSTTTVSHCSMCICPLINRLINSHIFSLSFLYLRIFLLR